MYNVFFFISYSISDIAYIEKNTFRKKVSNICNIKIIDVEKRLLKTYRYKTGPKETSFNVQQAVTTDVHTSV